MNSKQKIFFLILVLFLVSTSLKVYNLKTNTNFVARPALKYYIQASLDLFHLFDDFDFRNIAFRLFRAFNFPEGPTYIFANFLWLGFLTILKIPFTEFTLSLFAVLMGGLTTIAVFLLGNELKDIKIGFVSALFFIILPVAAGNYRYPGANSLVAPLLLLLSLLFIIRWLKKKSTIWPASLFIGLYFVSDNQYPGMFPLLFLITAYYQESRSLTQRIKKTFLKLLNWRIWIFPLVILYPMLNTWIYFGIRGDWTTSLFAHFFTQNMVSTENVGLIHFGGVQGIILACGLILTIALAISSIFGLTRLYQGKKEGFLFLWAFIYLAPWIFFLSLGTDYRIHLSQGVVPLIFLMVIMLFEIWRKKRSLRLVSLSIFLLISTFTLSSTLDYVYNVNTGLTPLVKEGLFSDVCHNSFLVNTENTTCQTPRYCYFGSDFDENWGLKTAGYFIRENTAHSDVIFSEIETASLKHYFGRPSFSNRYIWSYAGWSIEKKYSFLPQIFDKIDFIIVRACNYPAAKQHINSSFYKLATVYSNNDPVLLIFSKTKRDQVFLHTEIYDFLFDKKYGNWQSLYLEDHLPYKNIDLNRSFMTHFEEGFDKLMKEPPW